MAIDFQQIYTKIKEIGIGARERRERIENLRKHARNLLEQNANELDYLAESWNSLKKRIRTSVAPYRSTNLSHLTCPYLLPFNRMPRSSPQTVPRSTRTTRCHSVLPDQCRRDHHAHAIR